MWKAILSYYSQSPDLKEWIDNEDGKDVLRYDDDLMKRVVSAFSYQGFDPLKIITLMRNSHKKFIDSRTKIDLKFDYIVEGKPVKFEYDSHKTMKEDIQLIIAMFAQRGSSWEKIKTKATVRVEAILEVLKEKYDFDVTLHQPGVSLPPDVVTIPRVVASFPTLICTAYHKHCGKLMFSGDDYGIPSTLSQALYTPFIVSCIPPEWIDVQKNHHLFFFIIHIAIDDVIHRKNSTFTDLKSIFTYYKAAYSTPALPVKFRKNYMSSIGLANTTNTGFTPLLDDPRDGAEDLIKTLRPRDPNLTNVISDLKSLKTPGV